MPWTESKVAKLSIVSLINIFQKKKKEDKRMEQEMFANNGWERGEGSVMGKGIRDTFTKVS